MSIVERALDRVRHADRPAERKPEGSARALPTLPASPSAESRLETLAIDRNALCAAGVLPPESEWRQTTDEFRRIKWPLVRAAFPESGPAVANSNRLLVTSSLAGEGKSFVSVNLAFSIALERGIGVVLVDADLARPHTSEAFGVRGRRGLTDLLSERETDPEKIILATDTPGLRLVPAGTIDASAPELLSSHRMQQLLQWLDEKFANSIILFDSPPLLVSNEAQVLSHMVGQVLMVISADNTRQSEVQEAIALLGEGPAVKCVLNKLSPAFSRGYGAYYGQTSDVATQT
jgi:exopolysaccharide/PEP-CTERM locus tyrosine autokinase